MVSSFKAFPTNQIRILFSAFVLLLSFQVSANIELNASVDRNPVMERESFVLKIEANDSVNTNDLDLSSLQKTGFIVGRTATGSQTQIINGSIQKSTTWSVVLTAKQQGTYAIPALKLANASTSPIEVNVVRASTSKNYKDESIFIKNTLETNNLYVQQSVKLTTKLYISPQVQLQSGSLSEPTLDGALIQQQGKDKDATEIINGIRYRVIERIYTITPQSSGDFTVVSPTFNGDVTAPSRRRSAFSSFSQSKPVTAFGQDFTINVQPIPTSYTGVWLPSSIVQLNEEWSPSKDTFDVGEPITRTITLTALNVNEEQLPEVSGQYPANVKVYPDQSKTHSVVRQNALVSQRITSEAVVANAPGTYTFPEVKVTWFNTKTKRQDVATLPAKTITVVGNEITSTTLDNTAGSQSLNGASANKNQQSDCDCNLAGTSDNTDKLGLVYWIGLGSGWLAFIIMLLIYIFRSNKPTPNQTVSLDVNSPQKFDINELKRACLSHQANTTSSLLAEWITINFPESTSYDDAKKHMSAELIMSIDDLNKARFSQTQNGWKGELLWQAISKFNKSKSTVSKSQFLPPLNKA
ncbi:BatD family protein [Psychrosphaera haliotis]|uniref:BatD family protein n=1 Tax=Psychrosphaera haliotis TaxID=555083 RepID=UPI0012DA0F56